MIKLTNDQNIKNLKARKELRIFIIIFGILTIVLAIFALTIKLSFIYSLISFIIMTILTKKRESIPIKVSKAIETKRTENTIKKAKK